MARMTELFIITLDLVVQRPGAPLHTLVEQLDTIDLHHRISQIHTVRAAETQKLKYREAKTKGYTGEQCPACGSMRVKRNGACTVCEDCGTTSGCS